MKPTKAEKAKALRYKRPALQALGAEFLRNELYDIEEACADVKYWVDQDDNDETLLNAMDGEEDEAWEFKMAFSDLYAKAEQLDSIINNLECDDFYRDFDDCTVALIGNRYQVLGYDTEEEDYYSLTAYEKELAETEAGKRLMRKTKAEMISTIGQCFGLEMAFLDLRQSYDYLKSTFDILRDENTSMLQTIREIEKAYEAAEAVGFYEWYDASKKFNALLGELPDRAWIE